MLFNSIEFAIFLPIVFCLYWFVTNKNLTAQNILLLTAGYLFYGWWDWRFLFLLALSTTMDYAVGIKIYESRSPQTKKRWLWVSMIFNLGLLGFFKYYNFFAHSWVEAFRSIGYEMNPWTLKVILPVGISFYTFQSISYSMDIYRNKIVPTRNFLAFATFVSFFPQLVAGPIERAANMLPQMIKKREFKYAQAVEGIKLMIWGLFKKIAIADSLAPAVNDIFKNYEHYSGGTLIMGALFFSFQIYADFSGYTDIARGTAKLFGFELMLNFNFPYMSRSIGEFWRKWHISLSTWFRDYLYIPIGGSKVNKWKGIRNVFVIFLVSGFWHGANWTYIAWGGIHAMLFIPSFVMGTNRKDVEDVISETKRFFSLKEMGQIVLTFCLVTMAWIFFRADSIENAVHFIGRMFTHPSFSFAEHWKTNEMMAINMKGILAVLNLGVYYYLFKRNLLNSKWIWFFLLVELLFLGSTRNAVDFIYFQF